MLAFSLTLLLKPGPHRAGSGTAPLPSNLLSHTRASSSFDPPQLSFCLPVGCGMTFIYTSSLAAWVGALGGGKDLTCLAWKAARLLARTRAERPCHRWEGEADQKPGSVPEMKATFF